MSHIELEEGEAYYFRDGVVENVDPDRDFSYIDQKVETLLGVYRKDFMNGYSAEYRGPRYGDYGSFLPMYERPTPVLPDLRSQSHVSPKIPPNLPSEENPTVATNALMPAKTITVSNDQIGKSLLNSGVSTVNNQLKAQTSVEGPSNPQQQPKNPIIPYSAQNSLNFTVKIAPESMLAQNKAAMYSGLGLDMSPMSSPEITPFKFDRNLSDFPRIKPESPCFIIKIMTSAPLPNEALLSPLHDDFLCLMDLDEALETCFPVIGQGSAYLEGVNGGTDERKLITRTENSRKDASMEREPKQNLIKQKPANEFPSNFSDFGAIRGERMETLVGNKIVSNTPVYAVAARSKETRLPDLRPSIAFDKAREVGFVEDGKLNNMRSRSEDDKNKLANIKVEPGTNKKNEFGRRESEANKFKQHHVLNDIMKEEDVDLVCPSEADDYRKRSVKRADIREEMKQHDSVYFESLKQKSSIKAASHLQTGPSLDEPPSSLVKKKLKDRHIGNASYTEPVRRGIVNSNGQVAPSKSSKGDINLPVEMRKDSYVPVIENPSKGGNEMSSRKIAMGLPLRNEELSARKTKEQLTNKINGSVNARLKVEGDMHVAGGNVFSGRYPIGELPPPENGSIVPLEMEDWVQCENCEKWRLLPFGRNPSSLPKEWICSMLTWLPGMNKCSVSEDETTQALRALYLPLASGSGLQMQNNQHIHLDGVASANASVKVTSAAQGVGLFNIGKSGDVLLGRGRKNDLMKLGTVAAVQIGGHDLHRPVKNDPELSGGLRNPNNLTKLPLEKPCATAGAGRPLKVPKQRMAEAEVSGLLKKTKNLPPQSVGSPIVIGLCAPNFYGGSSERVPSKVKNRGHSNMIVTDDAANNLSKKRKLKDQKQSIEASESFGNGQRPVNNVVSGKNSGTERRTETQMNTSNTGAKESIAEKGHERTNVNARKAADVRNSFEKARDLGLSDNGATLSPSKVSIKVRGKASEVKSSPAGSISSSPMKICKSDPDRGTKMVVGSYYEPDELPSGKRLKSSAEGTTGSRVLVPHNEDIKGRKSNLSRISGMMSDAAHEDNFSGKLSSGRQSSAHTDHFQPKLEDFDRPDGKLDHRHHEGGYVALQRNVETQLGNGLLAPEKGGVKELLLHTNHVSGYEKGSGSKSVRVDSGNGKISRQVLDDQSSFRPPHNAAFTSKDTEASSSKNMDNSHTSAKTALKEAKDLKHSANRLKTAGSRLSTGIFFQAALKFLHGASLLEPGIDEIGRIGEMVPTEVYSSTAKLCEYCAHEYEKCNDMASAALAYKCTEIAYMRVVYNNDPAASRDRMEVQMAVRAAPQVDSPSSSASDIDNLNNQLAIDPARDAHSVMDHRSHVISARNRPSFVRLLNYTNDINLAMEASRRSQSAFAVAHPILLQEGNEDGISSIKRVLDLSFHDVGGLLHLVRLAMEALNY